MYYKHCLMSQTNIISNDSCNWPLTFRLTVAERAKTQLSHWFELTSLMMQRFVLEPNKVGSTLKTQGCLAKNLNVVQL